MRYSSSSHQGSEKDDLRGGSERGFIRKWDVVVVVALLLIWLVVIIVLSVDNSAKLMELNEERNGSETKNEPAIWTILSGLNLPGLSGLNLPGLSGLNLPGLSGSKRFDLSRTGLSCLSGSALAETFLSTGSSLPVPDSLNLPLSKINPPRGILGVRWEESPLPREGFWFEFQADMVRKSHRLKQSRVRSDPTYWRDPQDGSSGPQCADSGMKQRRYRNESAGSPMNEGVRNESAGLRAVVFVLCFVYSAGFARSPQPSAYSLQPKKQVAQRFLNIDRKCFNETSTGFSFHLAKKLELHSIEREIQ